MSQKTEENKMGKKEYIQPIPTTDIIIRYNDGTKEGLVLIERRNEPKGIALPGGFAELNLTLSDNARKEAKEETGLDVKLDSTQPFLLSDDPNRDPRGHMISHAYSGQGYGTLKAGDDAKQAFLCSIDEVVDLVQGGTLEGMKLVFDHAEILKTYLEQQQGKH